MPPQYCCGENGKYDNRCFKQSDKCMGAPSCTFSSSTCLPPLTHKQTGNMFGGNCVDPDGGYDCIDYNENEQSCTAHKNTNKKPCEWQGSHFNPSWAPSKSGDYQSSFKPSGDPSTWTGKFGEMAMAPATKQQIMASGGLCGGTGNVLCNLLGHAINLPAVDFFSVGENPLAKGTPRAIWDQTSFSPDDSKTKCFSLLNLSESAVSSIGSTRTNEAYVKQLGANVGITGSTQALGGSLKGSLTMGGGLSKTSNKFHNSVTLNLGVSGFTALFTGLGNGNPDANECPLTLSDEFFKDYMNCSLKPGDIPAEKCWGTSPSEQTDKCKDIDATTFSTLEFTNWNPNLRDMNNLRYVPQSRTRVGNNVADNIYAFQEKWGTHLLVAIVFGAGVKGAAVKNDATATDDNEVHASLCAQLKDNDEIPCGSSAKCSYSQGTYCKDNTSCEDCTECPDGSIATQMCGGHMDTKCEETFQCGDSTGGCTAGQYCKDNTECVSCSQCPTICNNCACSGPPADPVGNDGTGNPCKMDPNNDQACAGNIHNSKYNCKLQCDNNCDPSKFKRKDGSCKDRTDTVCINPSNEPFTVEYYKENAGKKFATSRDYDPTLSASSKKIIVRNNLRMSAPTEEKGNGPAFNASGCASFKRYTGSQAETGTTDQRLLVYGGNQAERVKLFDKYSGKGLFGLYSKQAQDDLNKFFLSVKPNTSYPPCGSTDATTDDCFDANTVSEIDWVFENIFTWGRDEIRKYIDYNTQIWTKNNVGYLSLPGHFTNADANPLQNTELKENNLKKFGKWGGLPVSFVKEKFLEQAFKNIRGLYMMDYYGCSAEVFPTNYLKGRDSDCTTITGARDEKCTPGKSNSDTCRKLKDSNNLQCIWQPQQNLPLNFMAQTQAPNTCVSSTLQHDLMCAHSNKNQDTCEAQMGSDGVSCEWIPTKHFVDYGCYNLEPSEMLEPSDAGLVGADFAHACSFPGNSSRSWSDSYGDCHFWPGGPLSKKFGGAIYNDEFFKEETGCGNYKGKGCKDLYTVAGGSTPYNSPLGPNLKKRVSANFNPNQILKWKGTTVIPRRTVNKWQSDHPPVGPGCQYDWNFGSDDTCITNFTPQFFASTDGHPSYQNTVWRLKDYQNDGFHYTNIADKIWDDTVDSKVSSLNTAEPVVDDQEMVVNPTTIISVDPSELLVNKYDFGDLSNEAMQQAKLHNCYSTRKLEDGGVQEVYWSPPGDDVECSAEEGGKHQCGGKSCAKIPTITRHWPHLAENNPHAFSS